MALEDGHFLASGYRYDSLLAGDSFSSSHLQRMRLLRVHPRFRVIALTVPVPRFGAIGSPLEPTLRSRFQAREVSSLSATSYLPLLLRQFPTLPQSLLQSITVVVETLRRLSNSNGESTAAQQLISRLPPFPLTSLFPLVQVLDTFAEHASPTLLSLSHRSNSSLAVLEFLRRIYPFDLLCDAAELDAIRAAVIGANDDANHRSPPARFRSTMHAIDYEPSSDSYRLTLTSDDGAPSRVISNIFGGSAGTSAFCISGKPQPLEANVGIQFVQLDQHTELLEAMLQDHVVGRDFCLIGERGGGKSKLISQFAGWLGYSPIEIETIHMHPEMSARDLLQRSEFFSSCCCSCSSFIFCHLLTHRFRHQQESHETMATLIGNGHR
jgi:hypothetical protein